jgi:hypothetical protein
MNWSRKIRDFLIYQVPNGLLELAFFLLIVACLALL